MINVLKRLAELDATNPNVDTGLTQVSPVQNISATENQLNECGGMMGSMDRPSVPASINMTAASGQELSSMLKDIMSLAGMASKSDEPVSSTPGPAITDVEPMNSMRSVIDKLHTDDTPEEGLVGGALGAAAGGAMGGIPGAMSGYATGSKVGDDLSGGDKKDESYDNTPSDPNEIPEFDANEYAHRENQPGQGDRYDGVNPRAFPTMEQLQNKLFHEYQQFINED